MNAIKVFLRGYLGGDDSELGHRYLGLLVSIGAALSLAGLVGITVAVGWHAVWKALVSADWGFVAIVPVAVAVSHLGYTLSYRETVGREEGCELSFREALALVVTGFGPVTPRGGFALDVRELCKRGVSEEQAALHVRVLGMLEYAVLAPATLAAAVYMMARGIQAQAGLLPSWVIGVPVGAIVALLLLRSYHRAGKPATWWDPLRHGLDAIDGLIELLSSWRKAPAAAFGMVIYWGSEVLALGACIDVFGHRHGAVAVIIVGYATGYALTRRTLPLAGAGVVEALLPFALEWVGFPLASSILAVIMYRIFNLWLPMVPAVVAARRLERQQPAIAPA